MRLYVNVIMSVDIRVKCALQKYIQCYYSAPMFNVIKKINVLNVLFVFVNVSLMF